MAAVARMVEGIPNRLAGDAVRSTPPRGRWSGPACLGRPTRGGDTGTSGAPQPPHDQASTAVWPPHTGHTQSPDVTSTTSLTRVPLARIGRPPRRLCAYYHGSPRGVSEALSRRSARDLAQSVTFVTDQAEVRSPECRKPRWSCAPSLKVCLAREGVACRNAWGRHRTRMGSSNAIEHQ